jgi:hypothetical protein
MRKTLRASVLMLALCVPAFAGDIPMVPAPQPPPSSNMTAEEPATNGMTQTGEADGFTETLLSVLETALVSVFALS